MANAAGRKGIFMDAAFITAGAAVYATAVTALTDRKSVV